jgi:hypothetical protein
MWWWSCYCRFCGQAKSQMLHMAISLAALLMKTLLLAETSAIALSLSLPLSLSSRNAHPK